MTIPDEPLKEIGLSHSWGADWNTHFSHITFDPSANKTIPQFHQHIVNGYKKLDKYVKANRIRICIVATTFGACDEIIVWQAKDSEAAKAFRDAVLAGNGHTSMTFYSSSSDAHGR
jgi:hypothetical protein